MELDSLSLTLPFEDHRTISLREGIVRSVDPSSQLLVMEVPTDAIDGTTLSDRAGIEAGASVAIRKLAEPTRGTLRWSLRAPLVGFTGVACVEQSCPRPVGGIYLIGSVLNIGDGMSERSLSDAVDLVDRPSCPAYASQQSVPIDSVSEARYRCRNCSCEFPRHTRHTIHGG